MVAATKTILKAPEGAPWLVLVHGMSGDHRVFSEQVPAFQDRYRILLVDLPGHGLSAAVPGPFGHGELAGHVQGALDEAGLGRLHYWGTHTGAAVGILLALRQPERFASLILEGPVLPGRVPPSVAREVSATQKVLEAEGQESAKRRWFDKSGWFDVMRSRPDECRAEAHRRIVADFGGVPWSEPGQPRPVAPVEADLTTLKVPVLAYNGAHDLADFVAITDELEGLLPNLQRHSIAEAGGFPAWEFPARVNAVVEAFLAEVDAPTGAARPAP